MFGRVVEGVVFFIVLILEILALLFNLALAGTISLAEWLKKSRCPNCGSRKSETLIGGMGGRACEKCGTKYGGMSENEYYGKIFNHS